MRTLFGDLLSLTIPDPAHSQVEDRFVIIGQSHQRELLVGQNPLRLSRPPRLRDRAPHFDFLPVTSPNLRPSRESTINCARRLARVSAFFALIIHQMAVR